MVQDSCGSSCLNFECPYRSYSHQVSKLPYWYYLVLTYDNTVLDMKNDHTICNNNNNDNNNNDNNNNKYLATIRITIIKVLPLLTWLTRFPKHRRSQLFDPPGDLAKAATATP